MNVTYINVTIMEKDEENKKKAIMKGGCLTLLIALIFLAISALCSFIDKILGI